MTAVPAFLKRSYRVGDRWRVEFSAARPALDQPTSLAVEWSPAKPPSLTARELRLYRRARGEFLAALMAAAGIDGAAAVLEA